MAVFLNDSYLLISWNVDYYQEVGGKKNKTKQSQNMWWLFYGNLKNTPSTLTYHNLLQLYSTFRCII